MYTCFGYGFFLLQVIRGKSTSLKVGYFGAAQFLFVFTILLFSRIGIMIALSISVMAVLYDQYLRFSSRTGATAYSILRLALQIMWLVGLVSLTWLPNQNQVKLKRAYTNIETLKEDPTKQNSYWRVEPRKVIWRSAYTLISQSPILGHGTGSTRPLLKMEYEKIQYPLGYQESYDAHNQILETWISLGGLGVICLLAMMFYFLNLAWRDQNELLLILVLIVGGTMLIESILEREAGILFVVFWFSLVASSRLLPSDESRAGE